VQRPFPAYLRKDLKPMTQLKYPRAADWLKLARGGHLTYMVRHLVPKQPRIANTEAEARAWREWSAATDRMHALHWMCTYIDALCAPELDDLQMQRIRLLRNKAAWHWYKFLPANMHTLLMHAMLHLAEQAEMYGPQCVFWLFHKERSAASSTTPIHALRM
jgi:hypothetical protein